MPLPPAEPREAIHTRSIEINGYRRTDGLFDIEAHLTDVKTYGQTNFDRGYINAGEPIHDMWIRLTIDGSSMTIVHVDAVSDKTPYQTCPTAAPNFARLVGLANDVGLLSEEYDPRNHRMLGNFPQAFSHLALVNTALNLETPAG